MTIFLGSGCLEIRIFGFPIQNKWGKFDFVPMKNIIVLIIVLKIVHNHNITTLNAVSGYNATVYFSFETYVLFSL